MNDIDKIVQIFQSGEYQLAIQLANGIGMSDMELLQYIWDNHKYENNDSLFDSIDCKFGKYTVTEIITTLPFYPYKIIWDLTNHTSGITLHTVFIVMLEDINRVN